MKLEGKVALVTGAGRDGRGIGEAICVALAAEGATVWVADFEMSNSKRVALKLLKRKQKAYSRKLDVTDYEQCVGLVRQIVEESKSLDILVNNAGITCDRVILRMTPDQWKSVLDVNLNGTFNCSRAAMRHGLNKPGDRIVNIASVIGEIGNIGQANYAASKGGVIALTKTNAKELGGKGVTVNAVAPGFIETAMTAVLDGEQREDILSKIPLGTFGASEDVASLVAYLCSPEARYITGQVINVDGGMVM